MNFLFALRFALAVEMNVEPLHVGMSIDRFGTPSVGEESASKHLMPYPDEVVGADASAKIEGDSAIEVLPIGRRLVTSSIPLAGRRL